MGTKMAPAFANLFMGKLEIELKRIGEQHILIWKRFIDDIFIIWTGSKDEFNTFMTKINQIHKTIKFTFELHETELTFLDITLYKGKRFHEKQILDMRTHIKPTNKQLYIHATSYHPPTTINAISKGETHRYLRTNSDKKEFEKMVFKLKNRLTQRGYKQNQIIEHIKTIQFNQRQQILYKQKTKNKKTPKLAFTTLWCDDAKRLKQTIKKHWRLIENNKTLREIFPEPPIIAYRNNDSLRKKLVRAKLKPIDDTDQMNQIKQTQIPNHTPLPADYPYNLFNESLQNFRNPIKRCCKACALCPILETRCFAESTTLKHKFPINPPKPKQFFNCKTKNTIYLAICKSPGCNSQYVGYTTRQIMFRIAEHVSNRNSPIYTHCVNSKHNPKDIKFQILTQAPAHEPNKELWLKRQEYYWICRLGTLNKLSKKGLNKMPYDPIFHTYTNH